MTFSTLICLGKKFNAYDFYVKFITPVVMKSTEIFKEIVAKKIYKST